MAKSSYTAQDIEVLEGLQPVRERPGMFIAGTDTPAGLHQLVFEILDNSVDEAMNGHASDIRVTLHRDQSSVTVSDNGRGIPVEKHPKYNKSALELILTTLHAGGKFSSKNYQTAGGLHGVGSSVVNALSEELIATVRRDGKEYQQTFSRGAPISSLKTVAKDIKGTGTTIFFKPDPQIFRAIKFDGKLLRETLKTKAYLNPGLSLTFIDETSKEKSTFNYREGLVAYLKEILQERSRQIIGDEPFVFERANGVQISIALAWTESTREEFLSYANGIYTPDGGSHEMGAKAGIVRAVKNYMTVHDLLPKGTKITADDIREGVVCLVSLKIPSTTMQAQFQGQTKSKLNNPEIAPIVEGALKSLEQSLNEKPKVAQAIVSRVVMAAKAREASRAAAQSVTRKLGISHRLTLPGKLADCSSTRQDQTELFIVEGDSAGGSAKQGRDRHYQAVLPLRGKVLNAITASSKKLSDNKELSNIVAALGCGVAEKFKIEKLRYGKVIIITDADADGMHIATLLLAFFFSHLPEVIEAGCLYLGKPPLYGIFPKRGGGGDISGKPKKGKSDSSALWAYAEGELKELITKNKLTNPRVVRYKGLGEMNPGTLWDTTLNPTSRTLLRVRVDDRAHVEQALASLMGSDSSGRSKLIHEYAGVLELDI